MTAALTDLVGTDRGTSSWFETSQADVDAHAETVGDGGWIHNDVERSAAGPYGGTLLQGSLMLANLARMARDLEWPTEGILNRFHYGFDRIRFVSPVPVGSRVRGHFTVSAVDEAPGQLTVHWDVSMELEGSDRPALVAAWITRIALED